MVSGSGGRADLVAARDEVAAGFGDHDPPSTLLGRRGGAHFSRRTLKVAGEPVE
ncbi:MAG: hypothetical protein ACRDWY_02400 [Actinomycetes bacterium]